MTKCYGKYGCMSLKHPWYSSHRVVNLFPKGHCAVYTYIRTVFLCIITLNRVLYCVVDTGYGLGRSLGDCRLALPKGRKYQLVKTQTESHVRRPVVWTNQWQIWGFFSFGDSPKLSSTGLATQWLIRRSEFIASYKKYFY